MAADGKSEEEIRASLKTVGYNPRFPQQNQTKHCWASYVEFQKCEAATPGDSRCAEFQRTYKSLCPQYWVDNWDDLVAAKRFPGQDIWDKSFQRGHH